MSSYLKSVDAFARRPRRFKNPRHITALRNTATMHVGCERRHNEVAKEESMFFGRSPAIGIRPYRQGEEDTVWTVGRQQVVEP
jgi:hypothetical protein